MKRLIKGNDRSLFGVCSGMANYFDIDTTVVRVLFLILALCFSGSFFVIYLILALLMPDK